MSFPNSWEYVGPLTREEQAELERVHRSEQERKPELGQATATPEFTPPPEAQNPQA